MTIVEEKIDRYLSFWNLDTDSDPLIGVDFAGFFPFEQFVSLRDIAEGSTICVESIDPEACRADYETVVSSTSTFDDDFIRGVSPIASIPWLEAMFGCRLKRSGGGLWAEERNLGWDELECISISAENTWRQLYLRFTEFLVAQAAGRWPVGLPILRGVTDCLGSLRGHAQSVIDCLEEPERSSRLARVCADALIALTWDHHHVAVPWHGGTFIDQYALWAPGPQVRLQEDASAVFSPGLFRDTILEEDRRIASKFPYSVIHLHGSSLFLIEEFLSIEEIDVFEVNRDVGDLDLQSILPFLKKIQDAGRRLYLRGPFDDADFRLMARHLSQVGLAIQPVVADKEAGREVLAAAHRAFARRGQTSGN